MAHLQVKSYNRQYCNDSYYSPLLLVQSIVNLKIKHKNYSGVLELQVQSVLLHKAASYGLTDHNIKMFQTASTTAYETDPVTHAT
jgi:hypothetical protein